ncbi:sister chromatid cohesion C-terminus-domain-containing protein [Neohortaea acidophila]|uniref:Sister chromatid cohesion protein n=1 Tax=Neohortaea acidophila TaxID=245834 RepID=A0A6A6PUL3_9PEZI|nr:sister chromatid cohesion C-terminus-domain-containing protein [Neohortaea acidophila]KAF2482917.1 sister chromatid cohesion C-terminus-domain-containing protein [Neohortaea acidophila]
MEGSKQTNGTAPHGDPSQQLPNTARKLRAPTVQEALPYTPLSSIVPFTPDVIPAPLALPTLTPAVLQSSADSANAKKLLHDLSSGATSAETASKRVQQTLKDVQKLLDPASLTQYKFKRLPPQPSNKANKDTTVPNPPLSSFAKMVLDNTKVSYRYLTPESEAESRNATNGTGVIPLPHSWNIKKQSSGHVAPSRPQTTPSSSQQRKVEAIIPQTLTPSQRAEFQRLADVSFDHARPMTTDQRQKGDAAVQNLQKLLSEVFDAEDAPTESDQQATPNPVFVVRDTGDGSVTILAPEVQARLDSSISKVITSGRFHDIQIDDLMHVQKICEVPVSTVQKLSLLVSSGWSESEEEDWVSRLGIAEVGLIASRTLMRTMSAGAHFKELQSEDFVSESLDVLKAVIERCVIPIIEEPPFAGEKIRGEKNQPPANPKFQAARDNQNALVSLINATSKSVRLLGDLVVKIDLDDASISRVEYLCKTLIFAENAISDKESAVGVQVFETLRRCAMDVLAKVFTKYTDQRQFIFDEILISLEKLPATKQSARQYRLTDAKPIQLVSALLMRLVQTSATKSTEALKLRSKAQNNEEDEADDASDEVSDEEESSDDESERKASPSKTRDADDDLPTIVRPLHEAARANAWYIVKVLTHRAANTSKTSDEPFRKLLDIFTDDFLNVLGLSDWPAAELLLRTLTMHMIQIVEGDKSTVPSRTLALELLGTMGSGILELQMATRAAIKAVDVKESPTARRLADLVTQFDAGQSDAAELISFDGPYRHVIHYLEARNTGEDAQLQTARGYYLMEWAFASISGREGSTDSDASETPRASKELQAKLKQMFAHPKWLEDQAGSFPLTTSEAQLASMIVTLRSPFCRAFDRIFKTLLNSMSSEQSRVKSRSMASVVALLEKDASILDRNQSVMGYIFRGATDPSSLVRESAMGLIDKCLALRPELDASVYRRVIERTRDAGVSVRKRALRMLKEMYMRNKTAEIRSPVSEAIISRIEDNEESVIELARATIEEIWFHPFYMLKLEGERAIQAKLAFASQAALFIQIVEDNERMLHVLEALVKRLLTVSKTADGNKRVCKTLVAVLFEGVVDSNEIPGSPGQDQILRSLTIFARASPDLFTTSQLERLEPYTQNLTNTDDLDVYRSVITILRNVMPHQPMMNTNTLKMLQTTLLTSVTKLQKPELREVAPCLWTIDNMLGDQGNPDRLPNFILSVMQKIYGMRGSDQTVVDDKTAATVAKLMRIACEFGNAYNFDSHLADFRKRCTWCTGDSVAGMLVETLCPFTSPKRALTLRVASLEAICTIAQAWPKQFLRVDVTNAFETVFKDRIPQLEEVLLTGLEGFFVAQEVPDGGEDAPVGSGVATGTERLGKTYVASDHDGASTSLAQRFLPHVLRIALASCDEAAFIAARLVVSINKQGLVHPKESAPVLVALETCPNKIVATEAFKEHKSQFQKHEALFEKEYMRAVQQTFEYQRDVIGDAAGYIGSPPTAKLHLTWEVLKTGKAQIRKKFLANLAQKLDLPLAKLDVAASGGSQPLAFVRFCLENMAFFEYDKVDDLLHLTASLEKIFAGTGSTLAQAIESEVLQLQVDAVVGASNIPYVNTSKPLSSSEPIPAPTLTPDRLLHLAMSSQLLCLIWETRSHLHKTWNLQKHLNKPKAQQTKDTQSKTASRASNAPYFAEAYFKRTKELLKPIDSAPAARQMCAAFVELISVDHEVKVASDDDAVDGDDSFAAGGGYATPSESTERGLSPSVPPSGGSKAGRKRKASGTPGGTPKKKGRPSFGKRRSGSGRFGEGDDEDEDGGWE